MDKQEPSAVTLDLSKLPSSDGTGQAKIAIPYINSKKMNSLVDLVQTILVPESPVLVLQLYTTIIGPLSSYRSTRFLLCKTCSQLSDLEQQAFVGVVVQGYAARHRGSEIHDRLHGLDIPNETWESSDRRWS